MTTKQLLRTAQRIIKIAVPIIAISCIIHIIMLLCGIDEICSEIFTETVGTLLLLISARIFGLCIAIKSLICYKYAVELCVILQRSYQIFGSYVDIARLLMLGVGIALLILLSRALNSTGSSPIA